jgi:hypothetical protein
MLASQNELKIESNHGVQQIQVSAEVVYLIAIVGFLFMAIVLRR